MKNKKFTYLLICCVAAVWGIIFYRIYSGLEEEETITQPLPKVKNEYFKLVDHANDRNELDLNYRDPFSSHVIEEPVKNTEERIVVNKPNTVQFMPKPQINWSGIVYTGQIYNPATKKRVVIINVNGHESMLTEGESSNGLKLIKNTGDSIKVQYQNAVKYLSIK